IALDPLVRAYAEHRYFLLKIRVVMFFALAAGLWFGVARFGLLGAIGTVVLVGVIERVALLVKFAGVLGVSRRDLPLFKDIAKVALASLAAAGAAAAVRALLPGVKPFFVLAACGTAFGVAYLAAVLLLKVVSEDEFDLLRERAASLQRRVYLKRAADTVS
ncbi:MAG TPA: hypothetical protein VFA21_09260, partial [Pyrinomonadaceae bacterium]|nr:hypothetical protein [Pyrinomonadaceae bacterium]